MNQQLIYIFGKEAIEKSENLFLDLFVKLQENIPPGKLQQILQVSILQYLENLDNEEVCAEILGISLGEFKTRAEDNDEKLLKDCVLAVVPKIAKAVFDEFKEVLTEKETEDFIVASIIIGMQQQ